jgi:hypothetical protein
MRRKVMQLGAAGSVALALAGCGLHMGSPPREGDTVTPKIAVLTLQWVAGQQAQIPVRLYAKNRDGSSARMLDFSGIPGNANPQATVTFYQGEQAQSSVQVSLNHRC